MEKYTYLDELESRSIYLIREAFREFKPNMAFLWSMGKDSTTLIYLARKAFLGRIPVSVVHIDTGFKFPRMYEFRDRIKREWELSLIIAKNERAIKKGISPEAGRFECCSALKTEALKQAIEKYRYNAVFAGIRRDEHSIRAKERYFSPRDKNFKWNYYNQPPELWHEYYKTKAKEEMHFRIHPLLHWREIDVWRYIKRENIPVVNLYFTENGKRYRSIGCTCCCRSVNSSATNVSEIVQELQKTRVSERAGRVQDKEKEYMMQKLRSLGYM